ADNVHDVRLWSHRRDQVEEINEKHGNERYLPNIKLQKNLLGYEHIAEAVQYADIDLFVVPTSAIRKDCAKIKDIVSVHTVFVHASKGIEQNSLKRIS